MEISDDNLKSQFSNLGFQVSDSVLDRCLELCDQYNVDAETFVETWTAYSITNLNGDGPTIETLLQMERNEFKKRDKNVFTNNSSPHSINKIKLGNKIDTGPKWKHQDNTQEAANIFNGRSNESILGQKISGNEPSKSPSRFSATQNVVAEFLQKGSRDWKAKCESSLDIYPYNDQCLSSSCKLMREPLSKKADVLNNNIELVGKCLISKNCLPEPSCNTQVSPTDVVCVGRICCDSNGHLNSSSVMLEGSRNLCLGQCVSLDLSRLSHYTLFPGQIVAVVGTNLTGQRIVVKKLFCSAPLPLPPHLPTLQGAIQILCAAGPFTFTDNSAYEPLEKLMNYVKDHKPHVLILIGPFVNLKNVQVADGSNETYNSLFQQIVKGIIDQLKGSWTQVILVSSANDAVCLPVYPTPAISNTNFTSLRCVSDPSLISINGIVIGLTATDSLMHLGKEEISFPGKSKDVIGRLASHLLDQQSFYPLYPPCNELFVDADLWDSYANLEVTPHLLIVPSNFRYFIRELHGCLLINPERVVKGNHGGTFARLEVNPPADNIWTPSTHVSAQILEL